MTKASASVRSSAFDLERASIPAATHQSIQIFGALAFSWEMGRRQYGRVLRWVGHHRHP